MVRPSSLQVAEHCSLAPWLAREFPGTSEAIERGNAVDRAVCEELLDHRKLGASEDPDVRACVAWLIKNVDLIGKYVQVPVELVEPGTTTVITTGTPDIAGFDMDAEGQAVIVDLKKREQWYAGRLAPPDENLQLHAYGIAHALQSGAPEYRTCLLLFGDGEATPVWSRSYTSADWLPILERIKKISARVMKGDGTRPRGFSGPHCTGCYQRSHCPHWILPPIEAQGAGALAEITRPGGITRDNAGRALVLYMQLQEAHDKLGEMLRDFVAAEGPIAVGEEKQWGPITCQGRKSADVSALERAGLHQFVKQGKPFLSYRLTRR